MIRKFQINENAELHLIDEFLIRREPGDLEVQTERAVVEIGRADRGEPVVDEHHLLMQEPPLVAIEFHSIGNDLLVIGEGRQPDEQMVRAFGDEDPDIDTADGGGLQGG